jgi:hypothetical protein
MPLWRENGHVRGMDVTPVQSPQRLHPRPFVLTSQDYRVKKRCPVPLPMILFGMLLQEWNGAGSIPALASVIAQREGREEP